MVLLLLLGLWLGAPCSVHAMLEDQFLYFPTTDIYITPAAAHLDYRDVSFSASDGTRLHGWFLKGEPDRPLVLFCHGNAGNIADRLEMLRFLHELGVSVFIFDYRGYGLSAGTPSEEGTYADGRGALAWLAQQGWPPERIIYLGRSLGAGVALQLALEQPPAGLVLETPFTSVAAMGRYHYPVLFRVAGWLLDARYDNLAKIDKLQAPLLIVQGTADDIVPPQMAQKLAQQAPEPTQLTLIQGAGHNDLFSDFGGNYRKSWLELLNRAGR